MGGGESKPWDPTCSKEFAQETCGRKYASCSHFYDDEKHVGYAKCVCIRDYYDICGYDVCKVYPDTCKNGGKCVTKQLARWMELGWDGKKQRAKGKFETEPEFECECAPGWHGKTCDKEGDGPGAFVEWFENLGTWGWLGVVGAVVFLLVLLVFVCKCVRKRNRRKKARQVEMKMQQEEIMYRKIQGDNSQFNGEYPNSNGECPQMYGEYPQSIHSYRSAMYPESRYTESRYPESRYPESRYAEPGHEDAPLNAIAPPDYAEVDCTRFPEDKQYAVDSRGDSVSHYGTHRSRHHDNQPKRATSRRSSDHRRSPNKHYTRSRHDNKHYSSRDDHHDGDIASRGSSQKYDGDYKIKSNVRSVYKGSEAGRSSRRNRDRRHRSSGRIDKRRNKMASRGSNTSLDTINQFLKEKEYV